MKGIFTAIRVELLKLWRSPIVWVTAAIFTLLPLMIGLIATGILTNPGGGDTAKDWNSYLALILQAYTGIGVLGMGFVASWLFGREYSDRTIKDLLALPISRRVLVTAKLIIMAIWGVVLSGLTVGVAIAMGYILGLEGASASIFTERLYDFSTLFGFVIMLSVPVAMVASMSRGYLAPLGLVVAAVVAAQFAGGLGIGMYFPWQIPTEYLLAANGEGPALSDLSYTIIRAVGITGALATIAWWRYADQT